MLPGHIRLPCHSGLEQLGVCLCTDQVLLDLGQLSTEHFTFPLSLYQMFSKVQGEGGGHVGCLRMFKAWHVHPSSFYEARRRRDGWEAEQQSCFALRAGRIRTLAALEMK